MKKTFAKLLVANRGEIAVRVMKTCRHLGIATVAVYSEPDARARHVKSADEAVALGGATAIESYLSIDKILEAARTTGADAIHPGYGFLSENPDFARTVADAGITFVGPPADAIVMMGDKMAAKRLAAKAGVPTIPGRQEPISDPAVACEAAADIGYPILLKPAAGGGGKGMRIVTEAGAMAEALAACQAEAGKAFGDDRVFLERYIGRPRHVEIQILADASGDVIYLGERECSIQRRYQKVIEEAPSPVVDAALRARMGESACDLARAAGYVNAGTVEFILDENGEFYFLEMNTRLQVEHPVTELTTGLDLVEQQLRIASGEPLGLRQQDVRIHGWAIEARICAEDPDRGFIPSTGPITRYEEPVGRHVRVDSGVEGGSHVSVYYDSLLAKVIAYGGSREEARGALVDALNGYHVEGPSTNIDFVNTVLNHPLFIEGALSTNFIAEHMEKPGALPAPPLERLHYMAIATTLVYQNRRSLVVESLKPMAPSVGGVRAAGDAYDYVVKAGEDVFLVQLIRHPTPNHWTVRVDDHSYDVITPDFEFYRRRLRLTIDRRRERFILRYEENFIRAAHCGIRRTFEIYSPREWALAEYMPAPLEAADTGLLVCPMPGLVVDVRVGDGERVYAGQVLLTLESMKMESGVSAPRDGEIRAVKVRKGQAVEAGDVLVEFVT
jgi:propionyl-CoA carboxylase alpha chain